jgi:HK97 family phage major capsid protein
MPPVTTTLHEQRKAALARAREIVEGAKGESRDLNDDERAEVEGKLTEVKDLDTKIKGKALVDSVMGLGSVEDEPTDDKPQAKTLGEHFAKHVGEEGFGKLKSIGGYTATAPEYTGFAAKANTDVNDLGGMPSVWLTDVDRTLVRTYRPGPVVADLLGSGSISGNAITYFLEGALEGDFTTVAEGAQKPQIHVADPTAVTDALKKIAAWWDTSDEMVEDLPFMVSEINNRAMERLGLFEEAQLLNGNGTGTNILGLLNRSGIQTEATAASPDTNADALFRAMTKVQTATGLAADGIIINPTDYQALRLSKDSNGQYYGGGFFAGPYGQGGVPMQPPLWGLRTVVTSAVAAGTAVVGAFSQAATVYRKGGVRVESTNSDLGKFTSNIITTRIEERVALAVRIPAAIVEVTLA